MAHELLERQKLTAENDSKYMTYIFTMNTDFRYYWNTKKAAVDYLKNYSLSKCADIRRLFKYSNDGIEYINCKYNKEI